VATDDDPTLSPLQEARDCQSINKEEEEEEEERDITH
jgi:hypothetical protein